MIPCIFVIASNNITNSNYKYYNHLEDGLYGDFNMFINNINELNTNTKISNTLPISFKCEKCGLEDTYQYRALKNKQNLLCHCCYKNAIYKNEEWLQKRKNKTEQTNLKKYGIKHYTNRLKSVETCTSTYGGCGFASKKIKEKIQNTNIRKHNNPNYRNTEKMVETSNINGGVGAARKTTKIKMESTLFNRTGYKHNWSIPEERKITFEKIKEANKEKYGVENVMQVPEIRAKIHKKWFYNNLYFDSSWELIYYIWLKDNNIDFEYQKDKLPYYFNNKLRYYEVDFTINGRYVEIKGPQSFDKTGKMINIYDRTLDDIANYKYYCMLTNNVEIITDIKPYKDYIINKYGKNYINLYRMDEDV